MRKLSVLLLLLFSIYLSGCGDFYDNYQEGYLWRLPLIDPYELKNGAESNPNDFNNDNWHLELRRVKMDNIVKGLNITMINVDKNIIYGYGTAYPFCHFIIDCRAGNERIFKNVSEWEAELRLLEVRPDHIYSAWELFSEFKQKGHLKWH